MQGYQTLEILREQAAQWEECVRELDVEVSEAQGLERAALIRDRAQASASLADVNAAIALLAP